MGKGKIEEKISKEESPFRICENCCEALEGEGLEKAILLLQWPIPCVINTH
jgi:hypothetical protein